MRRNTKRALISAGFCGFCLVLIEYRILGFVAMLTAVATLFLTIVYGGLAIAGRDDDVFDAYQEGKQTLAKSLVSFFKRNA